MMDGKIIIQPLNSENIQDYFDFFDAMKADHGPFCCYCTHWSMTEAELAEMEHRLASSKRDDFRTICREAAERLILSDRLHGYFAYLDGKVVGWCNAGDRNSYEFLARHVDRESAVDPSEKIYAIVCVDVAKAYQKRGIASALLDFVCADAQRQGYTAVEGYPHAYNIVDPEYLNIFARLYEGRGFEMVFESAEARIYRKLL